ncbi:amino acid ABC transporter permease [Neptunicoccus cionae]|uniref:Amino acid ABC transporter n=1 Tax=Neptunicoccus cionae TaxID=2035344 RepID=A0A916QU96_9RHOB|nr:amino acid ABC transporter permease [Amylibacter cionae]GGA11633.1 amino acid ABC transporter [Amylibacter cionae]
MKYETDLPVMLPLERHQSEPFLGLKSKHILTVALIAIIGPCVAFAQAPSGQESPLAVLVNWAPLLLKGFIFNLIISISAMAFGTAIGAILGLGQISLIAATRHSSWFVTQFFRNAPWLVLLFFAMFLLPFEINILGFKIPFPDWLKAILGLSLPVMANVSEIVRGAVRSLPSGQWEAAESLAYTRMQTLWLIILPQCVKRMLPPWMNLYSILTMATVLASIVGVSEVMTLTGQALASEGGRPELLAPFYGFVLLLFFIYCYPIARFTVWLEKKYAVIN